MRGAGLSKMVGRPEPAAPFPLVEKFVKDTDVRVAVHNHGPGDLYPSAVAGDSIRAIRPYDSRIGLCIDVGHSWLAGENPAAGHTRLSRASLRSAPLGYPAAEQRHGQAHRPGYRRRWDCEHQGHPGCAHRGPGFSHQAELEYLERTKDKSPVCVAESVGYLERNDFGRPVGGRSRSSNDPASHGNNPLPRPQWYTLSAAFLGWMLDGVEIGIFPIVARPALQEMLAVKGDQEVGLWIRCIRTTG